MPADNESIRRKAAALVALRRICADGRTLPPTVLQLLGLGTPDRWKNREISDGQSVGTYEVCASVVQFGGWVKQIDELRHDLAVVWHVTALRQRHLHAN